jgi:hypothetical protein
MAAIQPTIGGVSGSPTSQVAEAGRLLLLDGVAGGTYRVTGGRVFQAISTTDTLLASAGASAHVAFAQSYTVPANTFKASTRVRIHARVTVANASGTDTLECKLYLGTAVMTGTTLLTTTAVDPTTTSDFHAIDFDLVSRAAPSATSAIVGDGKWSTNTAGTEARGTAILATTNFATNAALVISLSGKWSSTTANTQSRLDDFYIEVIG